MGLLDKLAQRDPNYNKDLNKNKKEEGSGRQKLWDIFRSSTSGNGQPNDNKE